MRTNIDCIREPLWTREFRTVVLVNCLTYTGNFMLMSTIPLIAIQTGSSKLIAGLVAGIYSVTGFLSRLHIGNQLDKRDRNSILRTGLCILFLVVISYNFAVYSIIALLALRAVHGIGWSLSTTSTNTTASDLVPATRRTEGMGFFGLSISLAMVIGPGMGLFVLEHYGYVTLFAVSSCFIILSFVLSFSQNRRDEAHNAVTSHLDNDTSETETPAGQKAGIIERTALWPSFLFFIIVMTYSTIMIFLPPFAHDRHIKNFEIFFTVISISMMTTRLSLGKVADRFGVSRVILPGMFLLSVSLYLLFIATSLHMLLVAATLYGLGYGIVQPALNSMVVARAPKERRGAATATFLGAMDMGGIIGSLVWGGISQMFGFSRIYIISSVMIFAVIIIYFIIALALKRIEPKAV